MKNGTKIFRSALCGLLAFLLSISVMLTSCLVVIKLTALSPKWAASLVVKSDYSEELQKELKNRFVSHGAACNIDESFFDGVFENIITAQRIDELTEKSINDFYANDIETQGDYSDIEAELLEALKQYAEDKGYSLGEGTVSNLQVIAQELCEIYAKYAGLFKASYFKTAASLVSRYTPLLNYALAAVAGFSLIAAVIICLSFKKPSNWLRFLIYATSGASLMLFVAPVTALIMRIGSKINLADTSLYLFVSGFITNIFVSLIIAAAVVAVLTALLHIIRIKLLNSDK